MLSNLWTLCKFVVNVPALSRVNPAGIVVATNSAEVLWQLAPFVKPVSSWNVSTYWEFVFDLDKFSHAFRLKTKLSKEIKFLDSKWNKSFYGVYRERFWNGSLGEAEIYTA